MILVIWLFASNRKCRVGSLYGEFKIGLSIAVIVGMSAHPRGGAQLTQVAGQTQHAANGLSRIGRSRHPGPVSPSSVEVAFPRCPPRFAQPAHGQVAGL